MAPRSLCELFYDAVDRFHKPAHLLYKKDGVWKGISSEAFRIAVEELSMGLRELGVARGDRVAILSENRPEWAIADLATLVAGALDSPIYPTLTPSQVQYILKDSGACVVFVSNEAQAQKIIEIRSEAPALKHVICMEMPSRPGVLSFAEVREKGRSALEKNKDAVRQRASEVKPEDLATIIYTSGTTGDPKGVMLTHHNLTSNVMASTRAFQDLSQDDIALSFLPLCHVFERMGQYLLLHFGATIAYAEAIDKVPQNLMEVRPTLMFSVPRLYEKIYARVYEKVASDSPLKQRIFRWAVAVGKEAFDHQVNRTQPGLFLKAKRWIADRLVFQKIRERTGGRIRILVSGAAPLSREIAEFFGAIGLLILEGYGLTETSPVIAVNLPESIRPGSVGRPLDGVEVRIASDGEILVRGPNVMKGYYQKPEATAEALEPNGWFHTGDIGVLDADGYLMITDRKKDLLVTSGGKKVAPQPIENRLKANPLIAECVMVGNKRNFPAALLVPNFENLERWARDKGVSFQNRKDLIKNAEVKSLFDSTVNDVNKDLAQFEKIKKLTLLDSEFSIAAGQLTPTLKVKRRVVEEQFKGLIDQMYAGAAPEGGT